MKMKKRLSESRKIWYREHAGLCHVSVTVVYLGLQKDKAFALQMLPFLLPVLLGYVAFGMSLLLFFLCRRENRGIRKLKPLMGEGACGIYWIGNLFSFVSCSGIAGRRKKAGLIILLLDALLVAGFSHLGLPLYEPVLQEY